MGFWDKSFECIFSSQMAWTEAEHERLIRAVQKQPNPKRIHWEDVVEVVGTKDVRQCSAYWHRHHPTPETDMRKKWTMAEDFSIFKRRQRRWSWLQIAQRMGYSVEQVMNRYRVLKRKGYQIPKEFKDVPGSPPPVEVPAMEDHEPRQFETLNAEEWESFYTDLCEQIELPEWK
jgi:hypothetical protein